MLVKFLTLLSDVQSGE